MNPLDTFIILQIEPRGTVQTGLEALLDAPDEVGLEATSIPQEQPSLALVTGSISPITKTAFALIALLVIAGIPNQLVI